MTTNNAIKIVAYCARPDCAAAMSDASSNDAERKALSTLEAHAALAGHHCFKTEDGSIVLARWGLAAQFDTVSKAADWLERITGRSS